MLKTLGFISFIISCLTLIPRLSLAADGAYEIQAPHLTFDPKGEVFADFIQTCDSTFAGFLYRPDAEKGLRVGVVLMRKHARCLGLGVGERVRLPLLDAARFNSVTAIHPSQETPLLRTVPIQNLHQTLGDLTAVYTSLCGRPLGLLIAATAAGHAIGMIESSRAGDATTCVRNTKTYSISQLDLRSLGQTPLIPADRDGALPYSLRRVPVQLQADAGLFQGRRVFKVRFRRSCNEAPIGLVQRDQVGGALSVTMLVAHYPSMQCPESSPREFWTPWAERLSVTPGRKILTIHKLVDEDLRLVRPTSYQVAQKPQKTLVSVKTITSCQRDLGWVSRRQQGEWALGILQTSAAVSCNSPLKKVTYRVDVNSAPVTEVKPLQLVGS